MSKIGTKLWDLSNNHQVSPQWKKAKNVPFSLIEENRKSKKSKSSDATGMYEKSSRLWKVADAEALRKPQDIFDNLIFDILREAEQV